MRRECRERFPCHLLQRKPLVSDPGMHHGTCVMHVPLCMTRSLHRGGGENLTGIPGACATRNYTYLERDPWQGKSLGPVLLQWPDAYVILSVNGSAALNESCVPTGSTDAGLRQYHIVVKIEIVLCFVSMDNYRPVSLLPSISKVFEKDGLK